MNPVGTMGSWAVKRALYHSGLLGLARLSRQRVRGLVLRYHALTPSAADVNYATPEICLPVDAFALQMAFARRAYTVISLDELVEILHAGRELPPRTLAVTFDDGFADNYRLGHPVLHRLGLPATVYVATGAVDGGPSLWTSAVRALVLAAKGEELRVPGLPPLTLAPPGQRGPTVRVLTRALVPVPAAERVERLATAAAAAQVDLQRELAGTMLTWDEVREMSTSGWTIGAHTVQHINVALADPAVAEREISASREAIEAVTRVPVRHFAYPNSGNKHRYYDADVAGILRRLGFRSGATAKTGALRPGLDPLFLPRLGVSPRLAPVVDLAAAIERHRLAA